MIDDLFILILTPFAFDCFDLGFGLDNETPATPIPKS